MFCVCCVILLLFLIYIYIYMHIYMYIYIWCWVSYCFCWFLMFYVVSSICFCLGGFYVFCVVNMCFLLRLLVLVGWILELHEQSPRALRAKSKSFTSKVREPWAGKGLVWCGGLKSFTSKVQELYQQSPRASQARSGNHGLVGVWLGGLDSRASRAKSKSFTRKVQELYKQSQGTMGW